MSFENIIGHEKIIKNLQSTVENNRVLHAYIFSGIDGVGKTSTAYEFAMLLTDGSKEDITIVTNSFYNVDIKTNATSVNAVRAARSDMHVLPYKSKHRVFIFPDADKMGIGAQNALLKIFEEPPEYIVIILIAENEKQMLQTIRSRAVNVLFSPLPKSVINSRIQQNGITDSYTAEIYSELAQGSIGKADRLCENENVMNVVSEFCSLISKIKTENCSIVYKTVRFIEENKEYMDIISDVLLIVIRKNLLQNLRKDDKMFIEGLNTAAAVAAIELTEHSKIALKQNANFNSVINELILSIWEL